MLWVARRLCVIGCLVATWLGTSAGSATTFDGTFAPATGIVHPEATPWRQEPCLNGRWQFEPVDVPAGYVRDQGLPPALIEPTDSWDAVPLAGGSSRSLATTCS